MYKTTRVVYEDGMLRAKILRVGTVRFDILSKWMEYESTNRRNAAPWDWSRRGVWEKASIKNNLSQSEFKLRLALWQLR